MTITRRDSKKEVPAILHKEIKFNHTTDSSTQTEDNKSTTSESSAIQTPSTQPLPLNTDIKNSKIRALPDGRFVIARTGAIDIVSLKTGKLTNTLPIQREPESNIHRLFVLPNNGIGAHLSLSGEVIFWNAPDYKPEIIKEMVIHSDAVLLKNPTIPGIAAPYLATFSFGGALEIWNPATKKQIANADLRIQMGRITEQPNGELICCGENKIYRLKYDDKKIIRTWETRYERHLSTLRALTNDSFVTGDIYGNIKLWRQNKIVDTHSLLDNCYVEEITPLFDNRFIFCKISSLNPNNRTAHLQLCEITDDQKLIMRSKTPIQCKEDFSFDVLSNGDAVITTDSDNSLHFYRFPELKLLREQWENNFKTLKNDYFLNLVGLHPGVEEIVLRYHNQDYDLYKAYNAYGVFDDRDTKQVANIQTTQNTKPIADTKPNPVTFFNATTQTSAPIATMLTQSAIDKPKSLI